MAERKGGAKRPEEVWEMKKFLRKNLKSERAQEGLTQKQLAEKCGIGKQTLFQYESGYRFPSVFTLWKIAKALGCYMDELIEGDMEEHNGKDTRQEC